MSIHTAIKWSGTGLFALGAVSIAAFPNSMSLMPFAAFTAGHILWTITGFNMRDKAVITLNLMYLPLDFYAIAIRIM
jgi:hypothetical protein